MIKVLIEDCGVKLPAEMSIEGDALLITPNEPLRKDEPTDCEYIVSGWQDGEQRCIWVAIVKGNIAIKHGQMYYDTIAGVFVDSSFSAAESFWVDKHMGSAEFMRIADDEERKKLDDALAAHGLEFDKKKGELEMKEAEEWPKMDDKYWTIEFCTETKEFITIRFSYEEEDFDYNVKSIGLMFKTEAEAQAKCDVLSAAIKDL